MLLDHRWRLLVLIVGCCGKYHIYMFVDTSAVAAIIIVIKHQDDLRTMMLDLEIWKYVTIVSALFLAVFSLLRVNRCMMKSVCVCVCVCVCVRVRGGGGGRQRGRGTGMLVTNLCILIL